MFGESSRADVSPDGVDASFDAIERYRASGALRGLVYAPGDHVQAIAATDIIDRMHKRVYQEKRDLRRP